MQPNDDKSHDEDIEFEISLKCLDEHPREGEIIEAIARHLAEMEGLLEGDFDLMARMYATLGLSIYNVSSDDDTDVPIELGYAQFVEDIADELSSETLSFDHKPTARDISKTFRFSSSGKLLHLYQYGDDPSGGSITVKNLLSELGRIKPQLFEIEQEFRSLARDNDLQIALSVDPDNVRRVDDDVLFVNRDLYAGYQWTHLFHAFIGKCYRSFDIESLEKLSSACQDLPQMFETLLPESLHVAPQLLRNFQVELRAALHEGIPLTDARHLFNRHGLDNFDIAAKTLLDEMASNGVISKGFKAGKVAYFEV